MQKSNGTNKLEWWIRFRNPSEIIKNHPTFLIAEVYFYVAAFLCLIHSLRNGGRYKWLWLATFLHGLFVELISYFHPDINTFWHAQGMIMLAGQRLPLYMSFLYSFWYYTAVVAVSHMRLPWWAEPFAAGLTVVILDIPCDIMAVKLLWWTFHDTDPNIYDRHYWVPWTSYYSHAAFACGMTFAFHGIRKLLAKDEGKFQSAGFTKELVTCVLTGLLGLPLGVLQFLPVYHPLHDTHNIHTEVCVFIQMAVYVLIAWAGDRKASAERQQTGEHNMKKTYLNELVFAVILHYSVYVYLVFTSKPENIVSIGLHEPVGPCQEKVPVHTAFGHVLAKNKYLCVEKYDEAYFDFHCVEELPKPGSHWYTVCGTKFPNHLEYIVIVCAICAFGLGWFYQLLICSSALLQSRESKKQESKKKTKQS